MALGGASFSGLCRVVELPPRGMIALKGDLGAEALRAALAEAVGAAPPGRLRWAEGEGGRTAWMAPDELLLTVPRERLGAVLAGLDAALAGHHALVADVSDARAAFALSGGAARDVLAKLTPIDLRAEALQPGAARRTRLAQVAALILCEGARSFEVLVSRSQALYAFDLLRLAADLAAPLGLHDRGVGSPGASPRP